MGACGSSLEPPEQGTALMCQFGKHHPTVVEGNMSFEQPPPFQSGDDVGDAGPVKRDGAG